MKNLTQYNHRASVLFQNYLTHNLSLNELIKGLQKIENMHRLTVSEEGSLWFKFSIDDTLVTSIDDLQKDLSNANSEFTLERIGEGISLENELFIYYS
jgi:arsenate reductase-like glutaredoxin family protein